MYDFFVCDSLVTKQSQYITTLENLKKIQQQRILKFQNILFDEKGRKRKPLKVFFIWKHNRKIF